MADVKWIKIVTDIFDDEKIQAIETHKDGLQMIVVWFKILCLAGKCNQNGFLLIPPKTIYSAEMLSKIFKIKLKIVKNSLQLFKDLNMIDIVDNVYVVSKWADYQNNDKLQEMQKKNRERQQAYRDRQKEELAKTKDKRNVTNNVTSDIKNNVNCSYSYSNNNNVTYIRDIIDYFNSKCGKKFTYKNKSYNSKINARLEEGFTVDDFKAVIDKKHDEWVGTEFEKYLDPDTLFAPSKFEKYLNQKGKKNGRLETELDDTEDTGAAFDIRKLYKD